MTNDPEEIGGHLQDLKANIIFAFNAVSDALLRVIRDAYDMPNLDLDAEILQDLEGVMSSPYIVDPDDPDQLTQAEYDKEYLEGLLKTLPVIRYLVAERYSKDDQERMVATAQKNADPDYIFLGTPKDVRIPINTFAGIVNFTPGVLDYLLEEPDIPGYALPSDDLRMLRVFRLSFEW
jgi:hypothetical protein